MNLECLEGRQLLAGFSFADFSNPGGLSLIGDASITDNRLRLTPAIGGQEGAAWYTAEKQFVGTAFETSFQFQLTETADPPGGSDGLVFLIQNTAPTYLSGGGGTLGYDGLRNSLAVEFDTFQNSEANDPSHSHISVHTNGTGPNGWSESLSLGSYSTSPALLDDGAVHTVKLAYTPGSLSVYLDDLTTPKLAIAVDLAETLALDAGRAWVGFTATTGGGWENHDILNWNCTVLPDVSTTVSVNDPSVVEGDSGTSNLVFTVSRAGDTSGTTTVNWATENRTAAAGSDYTAASGQVVFAPGVAQQTVAVSVNGDTTIEPDETLALRLSSVTGGSIADGVGIGTILSDDVTVSVDDVTVPEGDTSIRFIDAFVGADSGGLARPRNVLFGPDGNLYVASNNSDEVLRYNGTTGAFLDVLATSGDGLDGPWPLAFGPDGNLYIGGALSHNILRWNSATGQVDEFVPSSAGINVPKGLAFDQAGNLYVSSGDSGTTDPAPDEVLRFEGPGGASPGSPLPAPGKPGAVFIAEGEGGADALDNPNGLAFGPDGTLYVANTRLDSVNRYTATTGAFIDVFVPTGSGGLDGPNYLAFRSDGFLYTTSQASHQILRYRAANGMFQDAIVPSGSGGLSSPFGLAFDSNGNLYVSSAVTSQVLRYGPASQAAFTISLSSASSSPITVSYTTANGTATGGSDYTPVSGTLTFAPGETTKTALVSTLDDGAGEPTETFVLDLSNPVGATIADGQGVGAILDNDPGPTKFYVVNDATTDRTYEYVANGTSGENYTLNSGNTAPRGAASTVAGNKVWVVDANKTVYVYDTAGAPLGSWTAGSLASNATVEGIATDGTDVWIVDARQDRVYRYTGAASRLSGSQNAASSFSLFVKGNRKFSPDYSNTNPRDIVTDGTSLWVINDGVSEDKVFKYSLGGVMAWTNGWTIDPANSQPTGITLDPGNPDHLWIVDAGTRRVYQYNDGVERVGGGLAWPASTSFALAAGNTNPQGIADPPVSATSVSRAATVSDLLRPPANSAVDVAAAVPGSWGGRPSGKMPGPPAAHSSVAVPEQSPVLIPLGPWGDQDLTFLVMEQIRSNVRRAKSSTRWSLG